MTRNQISIGDMTRLGSSLIVNLIGDSLFAIAKYPTTGRR